MDTRDRFRANRRTFMKGMSLTASGSVLAPWVVSGAAGAHVRESASVGWFGDIYRQLHIDAHFGGFRNIYEDFDAEAAARAFEKAGVQMVSYFAKCWAGYSYYPTKIGTPHPGLTRDFTGEMTAALKKRGIRCIIYFMLGMERRVHKDHPEWIRNTDPTHTVSKEGAGADEAMMCFRSPYVDEVGLPQMKEIIELYDPDGFFVDIVMQQFLQWNCYCRYCRKSFAEEVGGEMPVKDADPKAFAYRKWSNAHMEAFMEKVYSSLAEVKPDITIINNYAWMTRYPVTPPPYVHHITWDTPVPKVGLFPLNFSLEARYASTIPAITWSCMNTRGNTWGEYSLREPEAFMSECAVLLASCGRTYLSDIPYPHGNPDPAVMEIYGAVNERTRALELFLDGCEPVKDTAVLHSADSVWSKAPMKPTPTWLPGPAYHSVCGAHKALTEGHVQMGILNSEVFLDMIHEYNMLVLPDQRILSEEEVRTIRDFVGNGGRLLVTGETGTRDSDNNLLENFSIADVLGVDYLGSSDAANCYLRMKTGSGKFGIPAMDIQVAGGYTRVETTTARTLLDLVPPYEGIKTGTPPPALHTEGAGVTLNSYGKGKVIYCAAPLFTAYYREDTPVLRKLALWMLNLVYPEESRTLVLEGTPINVEVFFNRRNSEQFVHLVNYSGDKRETGIPQTQDFTTVHGITIHVKSGCRPRSVFLVPENRNMDFIYSDGWVTIEALPLGIHHAYRIAYR